MAFRSSVILSVFSCVLILNTCRFGRLCSAASETEGERIYNGIKLPEDWPPRLPELTREPMPVPYLKNPPALIPIDGGRQLFVDDFLIERTDLKRVYHRPVYHPENPILKADRPWERKGRAPCAMPFSDGVWYDPSEKLFKMWYMGGYVTATCYATSKDGIHWEKPLLDVQPGTNIVVKQVRDSGTVWLDYNAKNAAGRWKMFLTRHSQRTGRWHLTLRTSPDGVHWTEPVASSGPIGDRTTVFYNPFRRKWIYSLRINYGGRARAYREHSDPAKGLSWSPRDVYLWTGADRLDPRNPDPRFRKIAPQLYNLDAVAYESLLVGLFTIWEGPSNKECKRLGIQKRNELLVGFSRDGFHWYRPDRRPFIGVNPKEGAWNWGNVQSAGGCFLVVGDKLYFYVSGRALSDSFWDGNCQTGLAILRRDGFASMEAGGKEGTLTTRPVVFSQGRRLFVNVEAAGGELRAEVLDLAFRPIEPFTQSNCNPINEDSTLAEVTWKGARDLSSVAGKPVRFRFCVRAGSLYAFWVSPDGSGASYGYVAAGGPGFRGPRDTVGREAYKAAGLE